MTADSGNVHLPLNGKKNSAKSALTKLAAKSEQDKTIGETGFKEGPLTNGRGGCPELRSHDFSFNQKGRQVISDKAGRVEF